jgi:hypothetical protein
MRKNEFGKNDGKPDAEASHLVRSLGSIVLLLTGQLAIALVALILFSISFLVSPLNPLLWAQLLAFAILIFGGLALVVAVTWRHRDGLVSLLRAPLALRGKASVLEPDDAKPARKAD